MFFFSCIVQRIYEYCQLYSLNQPIINSIRTLRINLKELWPDILAWSSNMVVLYCQVSFDRQTQQTTETTKAFYCQTGSPSVTIIAPACSSSNSSRGISKLLQSQSKLFKKNKPAQWLLQPLNSDKNCSRTKWLNKSTLFAQLISIWISILNWISQQWEPIT